MSSLPSLSTLSALTSRFAFLGRWFRRQDDLKYEIQNDVQNVRHDRPYTATVTDSDVSTNGDGDGNGDGNSNGNGRRFLKRRRDKSSRDRSIAQLQHAYDEVIDLVGTLKQHMESQSERSDRLLTMMEGLPDALKSLPEANRNQTQTLQAIEGHLKQQNHHNEGLTQAIQGLAKAAGNQEHAMSLIQQQLDAGQQSREQMQANFGALSDTLQHMSDSNQAGAQLLHRLSDKHEQSEAQVQQLVARNQRQMTMMSIVSWSLAIVALAVAASVAIGVGRADAPSPTTAVAAPNTPAAQTAGVADINATSDNIASRTPTDAAAAAAKETDVQNTGSKDATPTEASANDTAADAAAQDMSSTLIKSPALTTPDLTANLLESESAPVTSDTPDVKNTDAP